MSDQSNENSDLFLNEDVSTYLSEDGKIAKSNKNFVFREGQLKMSKEYQNSLIESKMLICEAGTGTGKTFAYLLPALLSGKTILVSTASKALQDQLILKDLPAICNLLHIDHNYMALKGFSNYLCKDKYYELARKVATKTSLKFESVVDEKAKKIRQDADEKQEKSDLELLDDDSDFNHDFITPEIIAKLELLVQQTDKRITDNLNEIDFCEVNSKFDPKVVSKVTIQREYCKRKKCKYFDECFCYMARRKSTLSKVVVINHSLFFSTMELEEPFNYDIPSIMLPKYRAVIFDEAHELPSVGREHLSLTVGSYQKKTIQEDVAFIVKSFTDLPTNSIIDAYNLIKEALDKLHSYLLSKIKNADTAKVNFLFFKYDDYVDTNDINIQFNKVDKIFREKMVDLYSAYKKAKELFNQEKEINEDFFSSRVMLFTECMNTVVALMKLDVNEKGNIYYRKYVGTVDVSKKSFKLQLTPLEITEAFGKYLYNCQNNRVSVLCTSATICIDHKFNKFIADIGTSSDTKCIEVESNFDYKKQTAFFSSENFPDVNDPNRLNKIIDGLAPLIDKVLGGIFFLTTSINALKSLNDLCHLKFSKKRKIFCQYHGMSNSKMLEEFKKDGNAILIGTSSFWAGVDVPGNALSLVIIDKLPFTSPTDPLFKARCLYYDAKTNSKSSFAHICIPESVIELRQGAGRLIRHENDKGGLIICDPRLVNKPYGKIFLRSLPKMTSCNCIDDVLKFVEQKNSFIEI